MEVPELTLYYFDFGGKGEPIRLLLTYLGIPFTDYRFKGGEFQEKKASGEFSFGQVPALKVRKSDGSEEMLAQTASILRYVAQLGAKLGKGEVYPQSDLVLAAKLDAVMDQEADAFMGYRSAKYGARNGFGWMTDEQKQQVTDAVNLDVIPGHFKNLEKMIAKEGDWFHGGVNGEPSIAEFIWCVTLQGIEDGWTGDKTLVEKFSKLKALKEKFYSLPAIAQYYKERAPAA